MPEISEYPEVLDSLQLENKINILTSLEKQLNIFCVVVRHSLNAIKVQAEGFMHTLGWNGHPLTTCK